MPAPPATSPALASLKARQCVVWYYRDNAGEEPPRQAMQVIGLIVKHRRLIRLSPTPDFSGIVQAKP